jgi:hypothetical protein
MQSIELLRQDDYCALVGGHDLLAEKYEQHHEFGFLVAHRAGMQCPTLKQCAFVVAYDLWH